MALVLGAACVSPKTGGARAPDAADDEDAAIPAVDVAAPVDARGGDVASPDSGAGDGSAPVVSAPDSGSPVIPPADSGSPVSPSPDAAPVLADAAGPPGCRLDERRCGSDQTPETCGAAGQWVRGTRCQYVCGGNGVCGVCMPGNTQCRNGTFERCDGSGNWSAASGDCTPPTIVSVSPSNGAAGVRAGARIVITFSEPMDRMVTQSAFASADISSRTFSWDSSGTILTVTPTGGLQYATGANLSVAARRYAYSISTAATDTGGTRLQQGASATFTTLRRLSTQFGTVIKMSGHFGSDGTWVVEDGYAFCSCFGTPDNYERAVLTFTMASLPAGIVEIETARADLLEQAPIEPPAPLTLTRIQFNTPTSAVYNSSGTLVGNLTHQNDRYVLSNATLAELVFGDYMNRASFGNRTQFRIAPANCPSSDRCSLNPNEGTSTISITYLLP